MVREFRTSYVNHRENVHSIYKCTICNLLSIATTRNSESNFVCKQNYKKIMVGRRVKSSRAKLALLGSSLWCHLVSRVSFNLCVANIVKSKTDDSMNTWILGRILHITELICSLVKLTFWKNCTGCLLQINENICRVCFLSCWVSDSEEWVLVLLV